MSTTRLLIVQPYLPKYRFKFFELLIAALHTDGVDCRVSAGTAPRAHASRGDATDAPWLIHTPRRRVRVLGRSVGSLGSTKARRGADAVIVGLQGSSLDTYGALLERRTRRTRVGVWGHVKSYVNRASTVDEALERWQARQADHVFAYTPGGARHAEGYGVPPDRITTVMNSVDVSETLSAVARLEISELSAFQAQHRINPVNSACFIGGLDQVKRVGFLQEALDEIWTRDRSFKLLVGGRGIEENLLTPAVERGQAVMVGFAGAQEKALLARSSTVLAMPGRIGLVAVESLALGLPIITTNWAFHAPELEYLNEGSSCFTSDNDPKAYASLLMEQVLNHSSSARSEFNYPSLEGMVDHFRQGVHLMLAGNSTTTPENSKLETS